VTTPDAQPAPASPPAAPASPSAAPGSPPAASAPLPAAPAPHPAAPARPPARAALAGSRLDLLHLLRGEGAATVAALAARTGLHENTVRTHLDRLVGAGLAVREPEVRTVRGRPRTVYRAVADPTDPAGPAGPTDPADPAGAATAPGPARRLDEAAARSGLTRLLLDAYGAAEPDVAGAAVAAGERMLATLPGAPRPAATPGGAQAQRRALDAHLDRLGFDPAPDADGTTVRLWRCPFLDLARARPEVVCGVHLGLARAVLDRVGGPLRADALVPFAGPRHCDLHLSAAT